MSLMKWRPARDLWGIQEEMNRLFDEFFSRTPARFEEEGMWAPHVDISETKDDIIVVAEAPGMKKEDIKITVQDNVLTLKGEKKQEKEEKEANYHRIERSHGSFTRSFELPTTIQVDRIKANYKDGVLHISLPKAEEVKPKEISISVS
jgi:HSP20 family protein